MLLQALRRASIKGLGGGRGTGVWSGDSMVRQLLNCMLFQHILLMSLSSKVFASENLPERYVC